MLAVICDWGYTETYLLLESQKHEGGEEWKGGGGALNGRGVSMNKYGIWFNVRNRH